MQPTDTSPSQSRKLTTKHFFARKGVLSEWHPNYEYRPGQLEMADAVEQAIGILLDRAQRCAAAVRYAGCDDQGVGAVDRIGRGGCGRGKALVQQPERDLNGLLDI